MLHAAYNVGAGCTHRPSWCHATCFLPAGRPWCDKRPYVRLARGTLVIAMCNQARMATVLPRTVYRGPRPSNAYVHEPHAREPRSLSDGTLRWLATPARDRDHGLLNTVTGLPDFELWNRKEELTFRSLSIPLSLQSFSVLVIVASMLAKDELETTFSLMKIN